MGSPDIVIPTITVAIGLLALVTATRLRVGALLSPLSLTLLMMTAIFGVRPILMITEGSFEFLGRDVSRGVNVVGLLGIVSLVSLLAGYAFRKITGPRRQVGAMVAIIGHTEAVPERLLRRSVVACFALTISWFAIMIAVGGGTQFISVLFSGRSDAVAERLVGMPSLIPLLPTSGAVLVALARSIHESWRPLDRSDNLWYWLAIGVAIVPPFALGTRRMLIPAVVAALLGVARSRWNRRLSLRGLLLGLLLFVIVASIPYVRSAGSRTGRSDFVGALSEYLGSGGLRGVVDNFFLSYDTEMFSFLATTVPIAGDEVPFGFGRWILGDALLSPIPSAISPWQSWSSKVLQMVFGGDCDTGICPVPSIVGVLYLDLALPGLIVGMLAWGIWCAWFEERFCVAESKFSFAILLTLGAFTPLLVRGNTVNQLWLAVQVVVVVALLSRVVGRGMNRPGFGGGHDLRRRASD